MPRRRMFTTRRLFTSVHVATTGVALLLASGAFVTYDVLTIRDRRLRSLAAEVEMIGRNVAPALVSNDRDAAETTLNVLRADTQVLAAGIFRPDGVAFVTYVRDDLSAAATLVNASEGDGHMLIGNRLLVYRTITLAGEKIGSIRLLSAMEEVTASVLRHLATAVVIFIAAMGASLPVLFRLHKRISGPITELVSRARVVSGQQGDRGRATAPEEDEITLLVRTFNELLRRIRKRDEELEKARYVPAVAAPRADEKEEEGEEEEEEEGEKEQAQKREPEKAQEQEEEHEEAAAGEVIEGNVTSQAQLIENLLEVLESLRGPADLKGVRLQLAVDPRAIVIAVDPQGLGQILRNLLSNAIKSSPEGGRVQVAAHRIDTHVEISVSDTGRGIDPDSLPHVFERAQRADSTVTRADLVLDGLSLVRHLAELHGGRVRVESAGVGLGATFTVELPIAPPASR